MGNMVYYKEDFEVHFLKDTSNYYKKKATIWIEPDSCPDYMQRVEDCLKRERERVFHYLHTRTEKKLLEKVQHELADPAVQLLENEHSGCRALFRNDKANDLSRMYLSCSKIPKLLDPIVNVFKQHITDEFTTLVKLAEETAINQVLVRKVIELHDKYLAYVNNCFMHHTLFHKALKETFDVICNKTVAGSSSAELLSSFCDNILKKGGSEKMSDEAIEETLEKLAKLVEHIDDKDLFVEFYRKKLARRLLFDRSAYDDHEKYILRKLREQCGRQFT